MKNIKEFHGKPIIAYSIEAAQQSGLFERIVVSTDDAEIAEVATRYDAEVYIRDSAYCRDEVGTQEVARECLQGIGYDAAYACVIYATAPLMSLKDLVRGAEFCGWNFAFSVGTKPLQDAGQFYWGPVHDFVKSEPLISISTTMIPVATERVCDINTMEDFSRAEEMYSKLHGLGGA